MQITDVSNTSINWDDIPITMNPGETGNKYQRTFELGNVRLRIVEYSHGYNAYHWCCRGHIIYVLEGEIVSELNQGTNIILKKECPGSLAIIIKILIEFLLKMEHCYLSLIN